MFLPCGGYDRRGHAILKARKRFRAFNIAELYEYLVKKKKLNNSVAALFYTENCNTAKLQDEIETIVELLKSEKPKEISLFIAWFKYMFQDRKEAVKEIQKIEKVKSMLRTSIKKMEKEILNEGIQKGIKKGIQKQKRETAKALLKEKMPLEKIAEITGLSVNEIRKCHN